MSSEIFNKLKDFVVRESAVDDEKITRDTQIEDELGVTGDDAVEFMITYGRTFNVDVTKFMAADYFGSEGGIKMPSFIQKVFGIREQEKY